MPKTISIFIPGEIQPLERGSRFVAPLEARLRRENLGEIFEEGTHLGEENGRTIIKGAQLEVEVKNLAKALPIIAQILYDGGCPGDTTIKVPGKSGDAVYKLGDRSTGLVSLSNESVPKPKPVKRKRIKFGAIIELKTQKGYAYAQYTHESDFDGEMIRVFETLHDESQSDLEIIARGSVAFTTFFPLKWAVKEGMVNHVGQADITIENQKMPIFRWAGFHDPKTMKVSQWYLWDGEKYWKIDSLTEEQRKFPIRQICTIKSLEWDIETGWRPEDDPRI